LGRCTDAGAQDLAQNIKDITLAPVGTACQNLNDVPTQCERGTIGLR